MTTTTKLRSVKLILPEFRLSYPKLFKPEPNKLKGGALEFSAVALFPMGEKLIPLKTLAKELYEEVFGKDPTKWPSGKFAPNFPWRDQGDREKIVDGKPVMPVGYEKGALYLNLRNEQKPYAVDENVKEIMDPNDIYGGCYCQAAVNVRAFKHESGTNGVTLFLLGVKKTKDGEPFGAGRSNPEADFAPVAGAAGADPFAGASGGGEQAAPAYNPFA